jgi:hypothetical protein
MISFEKIPLHRSLALTPFLGDSFCKTDDALIVIAQTIWSVVYASDAICILLTAFAVASDQEQAGGTVQSQGMHRQLIERHR